MQVGQGVLRQVWLAPVGSPEEKKPFLIRDDAYSRSGAVFGRTIRLGDPVDVGPNSSWVQNTWQGGEGQDSWSDEEMVDESTADGTSKLGKLRLWQGWKEAQSEPMRQVGSFVTDTGAADYSDTQQLLIGESFNWLDLPSPVASFRLYSWKGGSLTTLKTFGNEIQAIATVEQETGSGAVKKLIVGTRNGNIWLYDSVAADFDAVQEHTMGLAHVGRNAICPYNGAVYVGAKYRLSRRTKDDADTVTYTKVRDHNWLNYIENFVVWNNRLWFTGRAYGNRCSLYVSDGTTSTEVLKVQGSFMATQLVVHYGSLYIVGIRQGGTGSYRGLGEVWRYNGASLQKIWGEDPEEESTEELAVWSACSYGTYLVWGRASAPSVGRAACLMYYDVELDAVHSGPNLAALTDPASTSVQLFGVTEWSDTVAAVAVDNREFETGVVEYPHATLFVQRGDRNVDHDVTMTGFSGHSFGNDLTPAVQQMVKSSVYDGSLPGQEKTWLTAKLLCKVPQGTTITVKAIFDEDGTEETIGTVTYDAGEPEWRRELLPMKVSGVYRHSTVIRYVLYLDALDPATYPGNSPEVDSLVIDFMPVPDRRMQWRLRIIAQDAQLTLDDEDSPMATREAIVTQLEDYWAGKSPVIYWDAGADGTEPADVDGIEVTITDFMDQPYRIISDEDEVISEVSMGLVQFNE